VKGRGAVMEAYIVDGVRVATGKRNGGLAKWHPADLGAHVINGLLERVGISKDPKRLEMIDDVVVGCVGQVGAQSSNLGRSMVLSSILPITVPGTTVDRQCGSSQQAIHFAVQGVMSGTQDIVIAAGVEVMSLVPIGSQVVVGLKNGLGHPFQSKGMTERFGEHQYSQFTGAELVAKKYGISRADLDQFAVQSHKNANEATSKGYFKREIIPIRAQSSDGKEFELLKDEGIRPGTNLEQLQKLKLLAEEGRHTAATASQISDGASAMLIVNQRGLAKLGVKPRARFVALALGGADPVTMLDAPIPATKNVLEKSGLKISDMDLYEVNEAFGAVPLAWAKAIGADLKKLNVNGGAQALGHPLGATGCKLMVSLLHELERRNSRYGLQAICEGGGTANATIIERIDPASFKPKPIQSKL